MVVPTYVDGTTQDAAGALALTFTVPAGASTGDFMIVFVKQSENTGQQLWDDDGGGGNGWILATQNRTTGGRDMECAIFWKFHDGSESNPTFTWNTSGTTEPMSGIFLVYSDVDAINPFSGPTYANGTNDGNPPNPSVEVLAANTRVICFHGATHDDISASGAPTGFTLRDFVYGGSGGHTNDHRDCWSADIEVDTIGTYAPPDWTHSVTNTTPEYQTYSIALNEILPIHVTDFNTTEEMLTWADTNLVITGDGFEATQATGKVEFWDDVAGTTKVQATIDSWSDLSIQIDPVQGALISDGTVYLVVTNDSGDVSIPLAVGVGLIPYADVIVTTLRADHYWKLNGVYDDTGFTGPARPMTSGVVGTWVFNGSGIVDDNNNALVYDSLTNRRETLDSVNMNITISSKERTLSCWIQLGSIQHSLATIWKEGGSVQNLAMLVGYGNVFMWQLADVAGSRDNVQAWSDFKLALDRPYHICGRYSHNEVPAESRLYIDGVEQTNSDGNPMTIGIFDSHSGDNTFGDSDNSLETGGTDIAYSGHNDALVSDFATWSDNSTGTNAGALGKIDDIRDRLFRRGAKPLDIIASGNVTTMQSAIDATTDARIDWPLSYRIQSVTESGGGAVTTYGPYIATSNSTDWETDWTGTGPAGAGINSSEVAGEWSWDNNETASSGVGPLTGNNDAGYIYTEMTSQTDGDTWTLEFDTAIDASANDINFEFFYSMRGDDAEATIEVQTNENSAGWVTRLTTGFGDEVVPATSAVTAPWYEKSVDLTGIVSGSSTLLRFLVTADTGGGGTTFWHNDVGFDDCTITVTEQASGDVQTADFELILNDKVFDEKITLHGEYRGVGNLTLVNSGTSNADGDKFWSPVGGTIIVINEVPVVVTVTDFSGTAIENARVFVTAAAGDDLPFEDTVTITRSGSTATVTHTAHGVTNGEKVQIKNATQTEYNGVYVVTVTTTDEYTYTVSGTPTTPAAGTILSTAVLIDEYTDVSGEVSVNPRYSTDQAIVGIVRKGNPIPTFKDGSIAATILDTGINLTVLLISDD